MWLDDGFESQPPLVIKCLLPPKTSDLEEKQQQQQNDDVGHGMGD